MTTVIERQYRLRTLFDGQSLIARMHAKYPLLGCEPLVENATMKLHKKYWWSIAVVVVIGWAFSHSRLVALACAASKSTSHFVPDGRESRVLYEPGSEPLARVVSVALPQAVRTIEEQQYRPFSAPVRVYVCATLDSFEAYCPGARSAAGCVINKRLFLSPKLEATPERVPRIVTHELSHLHLQQRVGAIQLHLAAPPWFQEGLAVCVSEGGGAESVSEDDARRSIAAGAHFVPEKSGSLFFQQEAPAYRLSHHMFYRQSAMFVDYLRTRDERQFQALLAGIDSGQTVGNSCASAYGCNLDDIWREFLAGVTTKEADAETQLAPR